MREKATTYGFTIDDFVEHVHHPDAKGRVVSLDSMALELTIDRSHDHRSPWAPPQLITAPIREWRKISTWGGMPIVTTDRHTHIHRPDAFVAVDFNPNQKENTMLFIDDTTYIKANLDTAVDVAKKRLARLEQNLRIVTALPATDEFEVGAVLTFDKQFRNQDGTESKVYNYTAIKHVEGWSVTGRNNRIMTWETFVEWLCDDGLVLGVWHATTTEQIA